MPLTDDELKKTILPILQSMPSQGEDAVADSMVRIINEARAAAAQDTQPITGKTSDGYHTFDELYEYRMLYNAGFFTLLAGAAGAVPDFGHKFNVHKSKRHHDGEECFGGGWFIVMAQLPNGQISNHYELKDWDLFQIPEFERAATYDGHTPAEAAKRLKDYLGGA